jgi:hypothetical protein
MNIMQCSSAMVMIKCVSLDARLAWVYTKLVRATAIVEMVVISMLRTARQSRLDVGDRQMLSL